MQVSLIVIYVVASILVSFWFLVLNSSDRNLLLSARNYVDINGEQRFYRALNASTEGDNKPLVILLHGFQDRASWTGIYSGFHMLAAEEDFILALPEGFRSSWNVDFCCGFAYLHKKQDEEFILKMVENIKFKYKVDDSKVYVVGFSNGGALAQKLVANNPNVFSGAVSVMSGVGSGTYEIDLSNAKDSIMLVQGEYDRYTPSKSDQPEPQGFSFLPARKTLSAWVNHYNATELSKNINPSYSDEIYATGGEVKVVFRMYNRQEHRWPEWRLWRFDNSVPRSTVDMWKFLKGDLY